MAINRKRGLFGVLMFAVLLFNITATTFFIHSHNIEGWRIVHSHPYSDSSSAHSHTRSHILLLNNALHHDALIAEVVTSYEVFFTEIDNMHDVLNTPTFERTTHIISLRAPPAKA